MRTILALGIVLCWVAGVWMAAPYLAGLTGLKHPWPLLLGFAAGWVISLPLQGARRRLGLRLEAARIFLAAEQNVARSAGRFVG